jgi:hypothetical protein
MKYFPKSRIIPNQKTTPGQFVSANGAEYNGLYYTTFKGESFAGASPTSGSSYPLTISPTQTFPTSDIIDVSAYNYSKLKPQSAYLVDPEPYTPRPTEADYKAKKITRYFARQRSNTTFRLMEIDQATYEAFTTSKGNSNTALWKVVSVFWQIVGPLHNEKTNGILTQAGVIDTNQRILDKTEPNFIGIKQYLTDLTQFRRPF